MPDTLVALGDVPTVVSEPISRLRLTQADAVSIRSLAQRMLDETAGHSIKSQLQRFAVGSHELPMSVRQALVDLRLSDTHAGGLVLSGLSLIDSELGPTPSDGSVERTAEVALVDAMLLLIASLMGDPISHAGIDDGRLIRNVCPMPGREATQLGSSSTSELTWHVEDAFHDFRADWLFLFCLRNPQGTTTSFARLSDVPLSDETASMLFQERFLISPDSSHLGGEAVPPDQRIAVLSGDPAAPFLRLDPAFMSKPHDDDEAWRALTTFIEAIDRELGFVVLRPGDLFIIDNYRSVHGRRPFQAKYKGEDRWLRVAHTTADLRKSAGKRTGLHGRALVEQL